MSLLNRDCDSNFSFRNLTGLLCSAWFWILCDSAALKLNLLGPNYRRPRSNQSSVIRMMLERHKHFIIRFKMCEKCFSGSNICFFTFTFSHCQLTLFFHRDVIKCWTDDHITHRWKIRRIISLLICKLIIVQTRGGRHKGSSEAPTLLFFGSLW